jgi:hypothetical protein
MGVERQAGASIASGGTPGAHATTHVTGGSDVIADAVAGGAAGLMTGTMATKLAGIETAATADMTGAEIATALAGVTVPGNIVAAEDSTPSRRGQINTQVASRVTVESGAVDLYLGTWSAFDFTGTQRTHIRCQNDASTLWLGPSVINFTADFTNAAMFVNLASGTCGLGFKNSLSNLRINGRSQSANGAPTSGTWVQHDTIVDLNGVLWVCQTAGTPGVWTSSNATAVVRSQAATTDTLVLADAGKVIECNNASAITETVPPNSSVAFPVGTIIEFCQVGAGQVTLAAGAGVTLRNPHGLKTAVQWSTVKIRKRATDEWVVSGDSTV